MNTDDLVGQRFGRLLVNQRLESRGAGRGIYWQCTCDCGNVAPVRGARLRSGVTRSCGCLRAERPRFNDLTGQRFGRLIVDQRSTRRARSKNAHWLCVCDCGNVARVDAQCLKNGITRSCGCLRDEAATRPRPSIWGPRHHQWRGGRYTDNNGYVLLSVNGRKIQEHRYLMEQCLGRPLLPEETVHHRNGVRDDNRLENLELWSSAQPSGQRVEDKVAWAIELLTLYAPERLRSTS